LREGEIIADDQGVSQEKRTKIMASLERFKTKSKKPTFENKI
jgi:hypothetical protein